MLLPAQNAAEAAALGTVPVVALESLAQAVELLLGSQILPPTPVRTPLSARPGPVPDLAEVRGQETAKRALKIAAAGGRNLLKLWPDPGIGAGGDKGTGEAGYDLGRWIDPERVESSISRSLHFTTKLLKSPPERSPVLGIFFALSHFLSP